MKKDRVSVDIELTNACNASCSFCPRDKSPTPGRITRDVFCKAIERSMEYADRPDINLCGSGESLLHTDIVDFVAHVSSLGLDLHLASNGSLMTDDKARALIDAGLTKVVFNISSRGEHYRKTYKLDAETTQENILNFVHRAKGKCEVVISIVKHEVGFDYASEKSFWLEQGVDRVIDFKLINRGGALFDVPKLSDHEVNLARQSLREQRRPEICQAPFGYLFVGWDGYYYLCSHDWQRKKAVGHVSNDSIEATMPARLDAVQSRQPVCAGCSLDPANQCAAKMRDRGPLAMEAVS